MQKKTIEARGPNTSPFFNIEETLSAFEAEKNFAAQSEYKKSIAGIPWSDRLTAAVQAKQSRRLLSTQHFLQNLEEGGYSRAEAARKAAELAELYASQLIAIGTKRATAANLPRSRAALLAAGVNLRDAPNLTDKVDPYENWPEDLKPITERPKTPNKISRSDTPGSSKTKENSGFEKMELANSKNNLVEVATPGLAASALAAAAVKDLKDAAGLLFRTGDPATNVAIQVKKRYHCCLLVTATGSNIN